MPAKKALPPTKIPNLNKIPKNPISIISKINIVYVLGTLLIIASFLIGVLVTKIQYLEKDGGSNVLSGNIQADTGSDQPQAPKGPVDVDQGKLPVLGNKDAKVKIVEFSDFQCPFCKALFDEAFASIKKDYVDTGKVSFSYRHFPLSSIHPNAEKAAEASECANQQGKFWEYHDKLFETQTEWESLSSDQALEKFVSYANNLGINGETLRTCVSSGSMSEKVKEDQDAGTKAGVDGTPATFINGYLVSGAAPYENFKSIIDQELNK